MRVEGAQKLFSLKIIYLAVKLYYLLSTTQIFLNKIFKNFLCEPLISVLQEPPGYDPESYEQIEEN